MCLIINSTYLVLTGVWIIKVTLPSHTLLYFAIATDPSSTLELKSKLDTSNFQESSGMESESKSFGIEASVVEKDDEQPPITGMCL